VAGSAEGRNGGPRLTARVSRGQGHGESRGASGTLGGNHLAWALPVKPPSTRGRKARVRLDPLMALPPPEATSPSSAEEIDLGAAVRAAREGERWTSDASPP
jgi:hypothetical protein